ncbi:MAG: hypothetical protein M1573_01325 [Candidatus Parvarchaeota archaeon]|nr:hypothetical protein [Candidatus Parvarchaeota archaeon]
MSILGLDKILGGSEGARARKYRKYDLVLFGENHVSEGDLEKEIETIRKLKPDYLLMEGFNDLKPVRLAEAIPSVHLSIRSGLLDKISDPSEYRSRYNEISRIYSTIKDNVEKTKIMLKEKGIYDLRPAALEMLSDEEADKRFDLMEQKQNYKSMRDFVKKHENFEDTLDVPFAELPNTYVKYLLKQVLKDDRQDSELSQQLMDLLQTASDSDISGKINHTKMLAEAYKNNKNVMIAGVDLAYREKINAGNRKREEEMGSLFAKYAVEAKQYSMKALGIVGKTHVRERSPIFDYLRNADVSYKVLRPNSDYSYTKAVIYTAYIAGMSPSKEKEDKQSGGDKT